MRGWILLLIVFLALPLSAEPASTESLAGRVDFPRSLAGTDLEVLVHDAAPSEVENAQPAVVARTGVARGGLFSLDAITTTTTQLEVTGRDVRRARFAWPRDVAPGGRALFRVEEGTWLDVTVLDEATGRPVAGVLLGPIIPGADAPAGAPQLGYPFFARTDVSGRAVLTGLQRGVNYDVPVFGEGYLRQRLLLAHSLAHVVRLRAGGIGVAARVVGERTGRRFPAIDVLLTGGPEKLHTLRRADRDGRVRFDGVPTGTYRIIPMIPWMGDLEGLEVDLVPGMKYDGLVVPVPEGIDITGRVLDVETGRPVPGAEVQLRGETLPAGSLGSFRFQRVLGPWPVPVTASHPDYDFREEDQERDRWPVEGRSGRNVDDVPLKLRRKRFLVVTHTHAPEDARTPALELWHPAVREEGEPFRAVLRSQPEVLRLPTAGRRLAWIRTQSGACSDLLPLTTAEEQTTTTLTAATAPPAALEGRFTFVEGLPAPAFRIEIATTLDGFFEQPVAFMKGNPGAEGTFRFPSLPPGKMLLRLLRPEGFPYLEEKITLERGKTLQWERSIPRGLPFGGVVKGPGGVGLLEIQVTVWGTDPAGNPLRLQAMTKEGGKFRFEGWGGATLSEVRIEHFHYAPFSVADVPIPVEDYEITLEDRTGIPVDLDAPAGALPAARAVVLLGRERTGPAGSQWYYEAESTHAFAGAASLLVVPRAAGRLRIAAEADGRWDVSPPFAWDPANPGEPETLRLRPSHTASITVLPEGLSAEAIATLEAELVNTALPDDAPTTFEPSRRSADRLIFEGLPAGEYLLLLSTPEGESAARGGIALGNGESTEVRIPLQTLDGVLQGQVQDAAGSPLAGVRVEVLPADVPEPQPLDQATTGEDGRFAFAALPSGARVLVRASRGAESTLVEADTSGAADVVLQFTDPVRVTVVVPPALADRLRAGGPPVLLLPRFSGGSAVTLREAEPAPLDLLPGAYRVALGEQFLGEIAVPAAAEATVTLPAP